MIPLQGKRIVLGVTGGVAAYKAAELVRLLVKAGAAVDVVLTEAGSRFVGAATFQALSGHPVSTSLWDERFAGGMAHIDLTQVIARMRCWSRRQPPISSPSWRTAWPTICCRPFVLRAIAPCSLRRR